MGYTSPKLVSAAYLQSWAVTISEEPPMRVLPRRWLDIWGNKMFEVWQAATRAVTGIVFFRPGISQVSRSS